MLFVGLPVIVWLVSWLLSAIDFGVTDPRSGESLQVVNQLSADSMTAFLASMVNNFAHFHPIGVVLVAMLGIGVAEHTGFISSVLRAMLRYTTEQLLTPMIILVGIASHTAADAGYVMVISVPGEMVTYAGTGS
jgi:aminobenzoyl-glutamate transport protein